MTTHKRPYIGPSDAQANAEAAARRDRPFIEQSWRSFDKRRRVEPPKNLDALVAWFSEQYGMEVPHDTFYAVSDTWADHLRPGQERGKSDCECLACREYDSGGSKLGSPRDKGAWASFQSAMDAPHHKDEEGDLIHPMRSALAALRKERRYTHDAIMAVSFFGFDWRKLIDRPFYQTIHARSGMQERQLVMTMPEDVLEAVLVSGLTRLWWLLAEREPRVREIA